MPEIYLVSTLLMGVLLIAVARVVSRSGQRATPTGDAGGRSGFAEWSGRADSHSSRVVDIAYNPMTWTLSFVVLAVVFLVGAVLMLEGAGSAISGDLVQSVVLAVGGAVFLGFVFFGAFFAARDRVGQTAAAVAVASAVIGVLLLLGVVVALLQA